MICGKNVAPHAHGICSSLIVKVLFYLSKKKKKGFVLNVLKVEQLLWAFVDASTDGFYCYFVCSFYPIHVLVHL